jgi:hypothetical protein
VDIKIDRRNTTYINLSYLRKRPVQKNAIFKARSSADRFVRERSTVVRQDVQHPHGRDPDARLVGNNSEGSFFQQVFMLRYGKIACLVHVAKTQNFCLAPFEKAALCMVCMLHLLFTNK